MEFAKKHNLKIIEDAAQAIGVKWNGKHAGTFGDAGSFSFFADKTITTGEGGLVVTNDEKTYERLLYIRNQGRINRGSFIHPEIGYNFRMTDIQSAIGLTQLGKLPEIIEKKTHILSTYKENLDNRFKIVEPPAESNHIPFRVCITIDGGCEKLMNLLTENGVETRTFFYPLHNQPCYNKEENNNDDKFPMSLKMYHEGVCLPSFVGISDEEIKYICNIINQYV
jgi:perosamine synthetase